jgi:starch-binding outer membrane protein, SusD/RagB family
MSTKYFKIIAFSLLIAASSIQCKKSLLQIDPTIPNKTVENYYQTEAEALTAVTATYTPLQAMYNGAAWHIGDIMSDDCDLGGGGGGDGLETAALDNFSLDAFNPISFLMWAQCYFGIYRANLVLEKIPQVPVMNDNIRQRSLAEAKFLRALYFFHLVRLFGDVPLYTNVISLGDASTISRSPKADVYAQIIADLKDAETVLPLSYQLDDKGRATSGAAKGLLANVYLWMGDNTNAAAKALEVINSNQYSLWDNYADNFQLENENGKESIFEIQYRNGNSTFSDYGQGQKLNTYFGPRFQYIVASGGYGWNVPTLGLVQSYERTNPADLTTIIDKRRPGSMWMPGDKEEQLGYTQPASLVGSPYGFNIRKFFVPIYNTAGDVGGWSCALNVPYMRYSEILLIYAEAAGKSLGKSSIDKVRARAGLAALPDALTDQQYLDAIYTERRHEFAFEMHRWYDLLRYPDPNYFINVMKASGKTNITAKHRYLPIPQTERDKDPNLSQNEGY